MRTGLDASGPVKREGRAARLILTGFRFSSPVLQLVPSPLLLYSREPVRCVSQIENPKYDIHKEEDLTANPYTMTKSRLLRKNTDL